MNDHTGEQNWPQAIGSLRAAAREAPESGIVEVINYGRERDGVIPLWAGEGDLPTPRFICDAATRSLAAGETFYTYQRGLPELRQALSSYHERQFGGNFPPERFFVTTGGMHAIQIAINLVAGSGDEVLIPTPVWPNFAAAAAIAGARVTSIPMRFSDGEWDLDIDRLGAAIGPRTRAIFLNSPSNPIGWVADREDLAAILELARRHGVWIIADEIYGRFTYDDVGRAPSFTDVADPDDRILYVNTLSKNWSMTGWRIGWLMAPVELGQVIENLVQYSTTGVAAFMQRAAIVALEQGDSYVDHLVAQAARGRQLVCRALEATGKVQFQWPKGAFYLFFSIDGETDTDRLGLRLVDEARVGLAPGTAFGEGGQGYLRLCFVRGEASLAQATDRLVDWIETNG